MKARDVMASPVISVTPTTSVKEVAKTFLQQRISAVPYNLAAPRAHVFLDAVSME